MRVPFCLAVLSAVLAAPVNAEPFNKAGSATYRPTLVQKTAAAPNTATPRAANISFERRRPESGTSKPLVEIGEAKVLVHHGQPPAHKQDSQPDHDIGVRVLYWNSAAEATLIALLGKLVLRNGALSSCTVCGTRP